MEAALSDRKQWVKVSQCPLCGSDPEFHADFESAGKPGASVDYALCGRCGLVFQSLRMSDAELADYYAGAYRQQVQGQKGPTEKDLRVQHGRGRHLIRFLKPHLPSLSRCMDIGSSTGVLLDKLAEVFDCETIGVEPGEQYRQFSQDLGVETVSDLEELGDEAKGSFDLIVLSHVLEHIPNPVEYLRHLGSTWLTSTGHVLIEVPNLYAHDALEVAHLIAFSRQTLRETLRKAGFRLIRMRTHGAPRSKLIPLYLTALATRSDEHGDVPIASRALSVRARRKWGLIWRGIASKFLTRWAWLPWPEVD